MKQKSLYVCSQCGYETPKWLGKCPSCANWNTFEEVFAAPKKSFFPSVLRNTPQVIADIAADNEERCKTGMSELDRVLGGGIVSGSLILVGGDPGIGKSTLLLQICQSIGQKKRILYVSGEESLRQIKLRAERLNVNNQNLYLVSETEVEAVVECISSVKPDIVVIDSIQTMHRQDIASYAGSVPQVREAANTFMTIAKQSSIAMFIVGHVTKEGAIAGPRVLEHMVDCVLYFEGDRHMSFRILRAVKNRFGSTNEIGVFEMRSSGLAEIENPSAMLLEGRPVDSSGNAVICAMEGSRGVLAEVQALVTPTGFGNPRRMSSGVDLNRAILLIAVLEKRARLNLSNSDVYINIAGGLKVDETAADLGICAAIAAGFWDRTIPHDMIFIGEVGLGGELRGVTHLEKRIAEAGKLGFKSAIIPKQSIKGIQIPKNITTYEAGTLVQALSFIKSECIIH
ncbi:MAG: DNA repair protein RadA [Clostridia bacterium]|nr:DNA repair protein RadA [Clostridia bacterium]